MNRKLFSLCLFLCFILANCGKEPYKTHIREFPKINSLDINPFEPQVFIPLSSSPRGQTEFQIGILNERYLHDKYYVYWFLGYKPFPQGSLRCQQSISTRVSASEKLSSTAKSESAGITVKCKISHQDFALKHFSSILLEVFVVDREVNLSSILNSRGDRQFPLNSRWIKHVWMLTAE